MQAVDLWTMRFAHRRAWPDRQRCALPTAPAFVHKIHSLQSSLMKNPKPKLQGAALAAIQPDIAPEGAPTEPYLMVSGELV
jgi:hypothetical protein